MINQQSEYRQQKVLQALEDMPLMAILRGLKPENAIDTGKVLVDGGFRMLEVPLNSPDPFQSISLLRKNVPSDVVVGAGTVIQESDMYHLHRIGVDIAVMPHCKTSLI